ncbi:MAG: hypothetical protein QME50_03805 [Candidatus Bathyarchaeota archaeon]|nr:hypothetical protein [Candidatus Bathyarchaeota archaeon]
MVNFAVALKKVLKRLLLLRRLGRRLRFNGFTRVLLLSLGSP